MKAALTLVLLMVGCSEAAAKPPLANKVTMSVTEKGFEPADLRVKQGEPVELTITRKTEDTCANEIVIDEYKVNTKLPLNEAVVVTFTPSKTGTLKYGCAMKKMIGGKIYIE
ncbi:MAG TPA: cupredoxin domain-containing protein [Polyangiales bacterium]|nr:cupredoxin domain-containing protein [Polyangiales bacterium]